MAKEEDKLRIREVADIEAVMSTESGRRVLHRLIENAGVYRTSYSPEMQGDQALNMAFREGSRNQGLFLIAELQATTPALFIKMIEEHTDEPE